MCYSCLHILNNIKKKLEEHDSKKVVSVKVVKEIVPKGTQHGKTVGLLANKIWHWRLGHPCRGILMK